MDKFTRRRAIATCALLAVVGVSGFGIVKNRCESQCSAIPATYEYTDEVTTMPYTVTNISTTIETTTEAATTSVTTTAVTTEEAHLYTTACETCGADITGVYLTDTEVKILGTLVYLEGGVESYDCQKAIASTVINRMITSGDSLIETIYADNQYSVACMLDDSSPSDESLNAVMEVLNNGTTVPEYVTFFRAGYYHDWGDQVPYCRIDDTYFTYSQSLLDAYEN